MVPSGQEFKYELAKFIPFRDREVCERVRAIKKEDICKHPNPNFRIRIIEDPCGMNFEVAWDIVSRIKKSLEEGKKRFVMILPARIPRLAVSLINRTKISCKHVHTFNMDEYADEDGNTAPASWPRSFQKLMWDTFFGRIEKNLRPPENQIHFPSTRNINDYGKMIEDVGGPDVCYGGVGWSGHIAFCEPELGAEFKDNLEEFKKVGPRIVELSPMTIMQNSLLFGKCGDWSWHPPKAATVGPAQIVAAKLNVSRNDGYIGGGISWQRFIVRLVAHGPVTPLVPSSILQDLNTDFIILGAVAENCESLTQFRRPQYE